MRETLILAFLLAAPIAANAGPHTVSVRFIHGTGEQTNSLTVRPNESASFTGSVEGYLMNIRAELAPKGDAFKVAYYISSYPRADRALELKSIVLLKPGESLTVAEHGEWTVVVALDAAANGRRWKPDGRNYALTAVIAGRRFRMVNTDGGTESSFMVQTPGAGTARFSTVLSSAIGATRLTYYEFDDYKSALRDGFVKLPLNERTRAAGIDFLLEGAAPAAQPTK